MSNFGTPANRGPTNGLRVDLYKYLLPRLQEEDQASGAFGFAINWDDPNATWDTGSPSDVWDALGFRPVVQNLFYVLETAEGEELDVIESLDQIVDPFTAPEGMLSLIAASFGYDLEEGISEEKKRVVVSGLIDAYKRAGQFVGFRIFYRMVGVKVINVYPLWKKDINEEDNDYSRVRYSTVDESEELGPGGQTGYAGRFSVAPIRPGSIRITDGAVILRDDPAPISSGLLTGATAPIIGPNGETGTVNYSTGVFTLNFASPTAGAVNATYESISEEWPYHAARIDIEILLNPGGDLVNPVPLVDEEVVRNILARAEETRPIHVLLRALTLISELQDTVSPGATDEVACITKLKDVRPGAPDLGILGVDHTYMLDFVPDIAEDAAFIDQVVGGILTRRDYLFEDRTESICPLDALTIEGPPGGPFYA